jgi:hypothetical protein
MNDLCLLKSVDGLGERVVAARADAADRGFNPGIKQPFVYFIEIYFEVGADGLPWAVQRRISACVAYRPTRVRIRYEASESSPSSIGIASQSG